MESPHKTLTDALKNAQRLIKAVNIALTGTDIELPERNQFDDAIDRSVVILSLTALNEVLGILHTADQVLQNLMEGAK